MPIFSARGLDSASGLELELFVDAADATEAAAFARARFVRVSAIEPAAPARVPPTAPVFSAGAFLSASSAAPPPTTLARLYLRLMIGLGLACLIILGFLFTMKAREHLGRGKPGAPTITP